MSKTIEIKVVPNARKNELKDGKLYINAPPVDGKANEAVISFFAKEYGVKKRDVEIIRGEKSKNKVIKIVCEKKG